MASYDPAACALASGVKLSQLQEKPAGDDCKTPLGQMDCAKPGSPART